MIPIARLSRVTRHVIHLRWLGGKTQTRGAGAVEDDELTFKKDVTIDGDANLSVGLDATKAF
jgi:hypothetical protein